MKTVGKVVAGLVTVAATLLLASSPALAAKPGGGDSCAGVLSPDYIHTLTTVQGGVATTKINLADALGKCIRTLATVAGGTERDTLLMDLGGGDWRAVWTEGDGVNNADDGIAVFDFSVATGLQIQAIDEFHIDSGPVSSLEALPGGAFLYIYKVPYQSAVAAELWRVESPPTVTHTRLATIGSACSTNDFAVGPTGDDLYLLSTTEPTPGSRLHTIKQFSLGDPALATAVGACGGTDALQFNDGNTVQFAVGRCSGQTCIALERHNVQGIPCTPDYYRTDVFLRGTGLNIALQLAYPSWDSSGVLYGRLTGSTSKNSCTAKIYTQIVKRAISVAGSSISASNAAPLGTGHTLDAANAFDWER
jgi:hypothetical protein